MPRPTTRTTTLTATLAGLALALTACGGSVGSSGSAASGGSAAPAGDGELAQVQESGELRVGTEGTYSPFTFHDPATNELTGYDVEVARAVAEELGAILQVVPPAELSAEELA